MNTLTQPLRDEHKELIPHIERIREVADGIAERPLTQVRADAQEVYEFLTHHLIPHAMAEDAALYPAVQKALGSPDATRTMSRDHVEVGRYVEELDKLRESVSSANLDSLRRVLYGLYAIIKVHFAKEEEIYLPILDGQLSPEAAAEMFEALETAAHAAKHGLAA